MLRKFGQGGKDILARRGGAGRWQKPCGAVAECSSKACVGERPPEFSPHSIDLETRVHLALSKSCTNVHSNLIDREWLTIVRYMFGSEPQYQDANNHGVPARGRGSASLNPGNR